MFAGHDLSDDLFLDGKVKLFQPKHGYRAGTDPVLLAAACPAKPGQSVLELGCGVGTALMCLAARVPTEIYGVERLAEYAALAARNATRNGVKATIETADLTKLPTPLRDQIFDQVIINPPFFLGGKLAQDQGRASGRQEETSLSDWIDQALRRTRPKGFLTLIHLTERLSDVISLLDQRAGDIEIKPLSSREGQLPKRIIIRARKGARGVTKLYNPLILHDGASHTRDKDSFTREAKSILRHGKSLNF